MSYCERQFRRRADRAWSWRAREAVRKTHDLKRGALPPGQAKVVRWAWVPVLGPLVRWVLGWSLGRVGA